MKKHPLADCENCPLQDAKFACTSGPENARVAFVSRSPGRHDVRSNKPFAGPSGKVLDHLLNQHEVSRNEIITTNVVLCESDDPPTDAIKACKPRLESEVEDCDLIIAGGAEATRALTRYGTVHRARGFSINRTSVSGKRQRVVVTNNPALVYKNSDAYPDMVADFKRAFNPLPPPIYPKVEVIEDERSIRSILERWRSIKFDYLATDLEWNEHGPGIPIIECAGFSRDASKAVVFAGDGLRACLDELKSFYGREDIRFIWHNGKADTKVLRRNEISGRVDEDTFLQSYALDERPGYHTLEYLLSSEFGWKDYEPESVKHFKKTGELPDRKSRNELYKYNGWDTAGTFQLFGLLGSRVKAEKLEALYGRLRAATQRFVTVELNGFNYDVEEACNIADRSAIPKMLELTDDLRKISGHSLLNPNSPPQMKAVYYTDFELKHKLRDTGKKKLSTSTGKEVREQILDFNDFLCKAGTRDTVIKFAGQHRRYAKVQRIMSNYLVGLILRAQKDGKLYCRFNLGGTVSGRTSSSEPNFQNIIREGFEDIPGIRTLFLPSPGNVLVAADYSQAELRTCAKLSGDASILGIYRDSGRSLHKERAAAFYGPNYTKEEYVKSKNINFGVTYGQSAFAFAQMYHMPEKEAQAYIDSWWEEFPTLLEWTKETAKKGLKDGYVQSPFGHKRRFHLITDDNIGDLRREAVNFLPQNIAAWLTISSIVDLVDAGIRVVATVHDSIVVDCPIDEANDVAIFMKNVMQGQAIKQLGWEWDDIPFLADISIGPNWGDVKEVELELAA